MAIGIIFRIIWRFVILAAGAIVGWFFIFKLYPYAGSRIPAYIALLLLYCIFAYIVMPTLIRLFRIFIKPNRIPLYVATGDGWPSDPVNLALVVNNKAHLKRAMKEAGWYEADPMNFKNGLRELISIIINTAYPEAPLSRLYLFGRAQDIGFEIPTNLAQSARTRHHVRFWRLSEPPIDHKDHTQYAFWRKRLDGLFGGTKEIWIGAATEETHAVDFQWRTGQLTHGGSHDSNRERDFIIQTLKDTQQLKSVRHSQAGKRITFRGQQFRTIYITDGGIKVARLK
jgi:hypothetical protein